jgi:outer membrane protein insertion porin family
VKSRFITIWGAVLLAAPLAFPQEKANFPLESIRIVGNEAIPAERIIAATGLKIGAPITRPEFNEARDRLLATGAFESVGFDYKGSAKDTGFDATFRVTETTPLYRFRFEELPRTEAELRDALRKQEPIFVDAIPPTPQVMNRYSSALAKFLNNGTQVIGEVNSDTPGELMIVFRPLGTRLNISEVNFQGNSVLDKVELWKAINPVAVGTPYSEPLFRQMLDSSVRLAYEEKGRIRVVFPKIETAKSADNDGIDVAVTVEEGPAYKLGDVSFKGVTSREAPELNKLGNWAKDAVVNFAEIDSGIRRIQKSFREDGYLRVETPIARVVHDDTKTVDLTITIQPGPRFNMGKLTIKGLDILSEPAIRKAWRMNEGDAYKESYPDAFLAMIQSEGYFDNLARTGAEADLHEDTHKVDVTLTFLGAKAAAAADKKLR